jgi:hypothetical protein
VRRTGIPAFALPIVFFLAVVGAAACSNLNTAPGHVVSIFIDTLPYPSIVQNDTMRDTTGRVVPFKATAFNLAGDSLPGAVQFFSLDANLLRVTLSTNFPIATDSAPASVRIVAQAQSLQTTPTTVTIALRPDTVSHDSVATASGTPAFTTSDTTQLVRGFCAGAPTSAQMVALLRHRPTVSTNTFTGVDNFIMKWKIISPDSIAGTGSINDTAHFAYIVGANLLPAVRDTTKGGGFSTRFLTFGGEAFKRFRVDTDTVTVIVQAWATYRFTPALDSAAQVPGMVRDTIRFVNPSKC